MNKILLNGLQYEPNGAGISRYTAKLIETFIKEEYPIDILMRKECVDNQYSKNIIAVDKNIKNSTKRILEEQLMQIRHYGKYKAIHFPDYATPLFYSGPKVATIHDMAMHTMRDKYTFMQGLTKNMLLEYTIKAAKGLICNSEFTKKELLHYYPKVANKITVIPMGIDLPTMKISLNKGRRTLDQLMIHKPYMLYVGTIAPHKNIEVLIKAFANVKKLDKDYQLVIAGKKGWMYDEVFECVEALGLKKDVIFTDFVTEEQLEVLYQEASFFVSVSLYEGFGFPPLEAMVRGCATLVSDIDIFKETCQDAAIYCNPYDENDIANKMLHLIEHEQLKQTLELKGKQRVKEFTWEKTARKTYEVYQAILN